jgi:hypothetical protein
MAKGLLNYIFEGNSIEATDLISKSLYRRAGEVLTERRKQIISKMFAEGADLGVRSGNVLDPTKNDGLDAGHDWAMKNALLKRQFQEGKRRDFKKALREGRLKVTEPVKHAKLREAAQDARRKLNTKGTDVPGGIGSVPQKACGPQPSFKSVSGPSYSQTDLSGSGHVTESGSFSGYGNPHDQGRAAGREDNRKARAAEKITVTAKKSEITPGLKHQMQQYGFLDKGK